MPASDVDIDLGVDVNEGNAYESEGMVDLPDDSTSGNYFLCERSGWSDTSDSCDEFPCQKYFSSIFSHKFQVVRNASVFSVCHILSEILSPSHTRMSWLSGSAGFFKLK